MTAIPEAAIDAAVARLSAPSAEGGMGFGISAARSATRKALEAAAPHIVYAEVAARVAEQDAVRDDLAALLRLLGLGDHARPQSPREVFRECLAEIERRLDAEIAKLAAAREDERERIRKRLARLALGRDFAADLHAGAATAM